MLYTRLGGTGLVVSRIALGCMSFGSKQWRPWVLEEEDAMPFFRRAIEHGINFFDTADVYSLGVSEQITGKALREHARLDEVVVATKVRMKMAEGPTSMPRSLPSTLRSRPKNAPSSKPRISRILCGGGWMPRFPCNPLRRADDRSPFSHRYLYLSNSPMRLRRLVAALVLALPLVAGSALHAQPAATTRPFGTLREQAEQQQRWLRQRMETILPALMRKHGMDLWVIPMREYNEDPVFSSIVSPTTFAARRRTIYVFFDRCAASASADPGDGSCIERLALGGSSQGGIYREFRSSKVIDNPVGGRQAELWGDQQWQLLREVIEARKPKVIGIDVSRTHAFSDGLSAGELEGMTLALGGVWTSRFKRAEELPLELIASRLPEEAEFYGKLTELVHSLVGRMFSSEVVTPGVSRTQDLVWWWRQQVNDLGLGTWFQPSVSIQRKGSSADALGDNPVIERGDVLHCDVGITALGLNTDTQHMGYVLREGETEIPAGLARAMANSNRLQDILFEEVRPGRSGNEILRASLAKLRAEGISGTMYSHPIGKHGHGAGPLIGLWDYQEGVPGRGDVKVIPNMWYSSELQTTTPVPEWAGQPVRVAQEEDFIIGADGQPRWALKRQSEYHLIREKRTASESR